MQLRFVRFLRGEGLVRLVCMLAVAMAGIVHADETVASWPAGSSLQMSLSQDDDRTSDHQAASEPCHSCSVSAFVHIATRATCDPGSPAVPSGRLCHLRDFELPTTAPPPRS